MLFDVNSVVVTILLFFQWIAHSSRRETLFDAIWPLLLSSMSFVRPFLLHLRKMVHEWCTFLNKVSVLVLMLVRAILRSCVCPKTTRGRFRPFCFASKLPLGLPLVMASFADTVSLLPPVARSLYVLRLRVVQGDGGGGGGQKEGGAGGRGEDKASLIDRRDASAECVCC